MDEGTDLLRDARKVVLKTIEGSTAEERGDWGVMQEKIRADLKRFISKSTSHAAPDHAGDPGGLGRGHHRRLDFPGASRPALHARDRIRSSGHPKACASQQKIPVTICGALLVLARRPHLPPAAGALSLNAIEKAESRGRGSALVGPGVLLREVQSAAANSAQFYAPDPTENTSSIGGNIAANSSGSRSFSLPGATRRHVLSLRVAFMDGDIQAFRRGDKIQHGRRRFPCRAPPATPLRLPVIARHGMGRSHRRQRRRSGRRSFEAQLQFLPRSRRASRRRSLLPLRKPTPSETVDRWRPTPGLNMIEYIDHASLELMDTPHQAALMIGNRRRRRH